MGGQGVAGLQQGFPSAFPELGGLGKQLKKLFFGEVGPDPERLLIRRQQGGERPSAGSCSRHAGGHVNGVHIGPLLPVYLDGEVIPIEKPGYFRILKGFVGHYVTPVAG